MTAFVLSALLFLAPAQAGVVATVEDAAITTRLESVYGLNPYLGAFGIHVSTRGGVVTLSGRVEDNVQKQLAEDLAYEARGVTNVVNNLTVIPTTITEKQERAARQRITDKGVATAVRSRLLFHRDAKGLTIGVDVVNNVVTLHGVVNSEEQKDRLAQTAAETKGVSEVINQLVVRKKQERGFVSGIGRDASDEWTEKKIEAAIAVTRKISIRSVDVEVDDGICYLSGVVENEEQKKVIEDIARGYKGIQEVNNAIMVREGGVDIFDDATESRSKKRAQDVEVDKQKRKARQEAREAKSEANRSNAVVEETGPAPEPEPIEGVEPEDEPFPSIEERPLDAPR